MSARFFLDTNLFIYTFDLKATHKASLSEQLISDGILSGEAVISFQVVQEFINTALRRLKPPLSFNDTEQYLARVLQPLLAVHSSYRLYVQAFELTRLHSLSWYDSLIVAAAIEAGCSILYTEDLQHGQKFGNLQAQNPFL